MTLRSRVERNASLYLTSDTSYVDVSDDPTVGEDNEYAVFVTNADDVSPMEAIGLSDEYSKRWDIEIEYKMIRPLLPSIRSTD